MTGLRGKRKVGQSPGMTEPAEDEESPRRSMRIKELAFWRKPEISATSTARSPRPADANPDDDVGSVYVLRNRRVVVPKSSEPVVPKSSEPVVSKRKKYPSMAICASYVIGCFPGEETWHRGQTVGCAKLALEHYNRMNQGDEHELVDALNSNSFTFNGILVHVNFLAKRKGGTSCPMFFAEVKIGGEEHTCLSCVKMGPGVATESGCTACPTQIVHPAEPEC